MNRASTDCSEDASAAPSSSSGTGPTPPSVNWSAGIAATTADSSSSFTSACCRLPSEACHTRLVRALGSHVSWDRSAVTFTSARESARDALQDTAPPEGVGRVALHPNSSVAPAS